MSNISTPRARSKSCAVMATPLTSAIVTVSVDSAWAETSATDPASSRLQTRLVAGNRQRICLDREVSWYILMPSLGFVRPALSRCIGLLARRSEQAPATNRMPFCVHRRPSEPRSSDGPTHRYLRSEWYRRTSYRLPAAYFHVGWIYTA